MDRDLEIQLADKRAMDEASKYRVIRQETRTRKRKFWPFGRK